MEAEKTECAAADLSLEAAIKLWGNYPAAKISATSVVEEDDAETEKEFTQSQTKIKLSAVKSRINKLKKGVTFRGWVHPAPPVVGKRQQRAAEPDDMIEGWDVPAPDEYLFYRIAAAIVQVGNASVNDQLRGGGRTELDSHDNMCVLGKHCLLLSELETA